MEALDSIAPESGAEMSPAEIEALAAALDDARCSNSEKALLDVQRELAVAAWVLDTIASGQRQVPSDIVKLYAGALTEQARTVGKVRENLLGAASSCSREVSR